MKKTRKTLLAAMAGSLVAMATTSATILVSEPFDYNVGVWTSEAGTNWTTTMGSGSGTGWGSNNWFSHIGAGLKFGIGSGGHTGTFADSTGINYQANNWRERAMSPAVHGNSDGAVTWQHLSVSVNGTGTAGQLATQNSYGGGDFAVRVMADGTYALSAEHGNVKTQTSAIAASTNAGAPDIIVVKMENQTGTGLFDVSMWVNPTSSTAAGLPAPDLQILGASPFAGNRNIGSLNWMPGNTQIDNFKLASAYEDFGIGVVVTNPIIGVKDGVVSLTDGTGTVGFGSAVTGVAVIKTFTITNEGTTDLTLGAISKDGADAADFTVGAPGISIVAPGGSTTFTVTFTPSVYRSEAAAIHIANDSPGDLNPFDIALGGTGLAPISVHVDAAGLADGSATPVNFGSAPVGATLSKTFTITNDGTSDLTLGTISKDGANAADFTVGDLGSTTLTAGNSTTFTVSFTPSAVTTETAAIHIANSAPGDVNPFDITLTGTGLPPMSVLLGSATLTDGSATPVDFGSSLVGAAVSKTFTITNGGTTVLTLGAIGKDGAGAADFTVGPLGTTTVAAGGSTTFTVTFTPSAEATASAAIHIANDSLGDVNPFDIALTGSGHAPGATIVVTEPFDYPVGVATGPWSTTLGNASGTGWGGSAWFSHIGDALTFGIASGGHTGTFADSTGLNYLSNEWRQRNMSPAVHGNTDGAAIWEYLTMSRSGTGTTGQLTTENSNGGMQFAVRIDASGNYALVTGQRNVNLQTSAVAASTDPTHPDIIVVKMENQTGTGLFDVSMWINPTSSTAAGLPAPYLQIPGTSPFAGNRNLGSINWMPGNTQIDNFTLAGDYADFGIGTTPGGGYSAWATTNAGGQTAGEDYDHDGVANGVEYFMGATGPGFTTNPGVGPDNKVTWPKSAAFSGTYEVQTSSDLTNWTPAPGAAVSDTGTAVACDLSLLTPVAGKVFIRLMVMPN